MLIKPGFVSIFDSAPATYFGGVRKVEVFA